MTDKRLTAIERKLDGIQGTLNQIAVQNEQIVHLQGETSALWKKWDDFTRPDGELTRIVRHQASCPRGQIKFLWWVVISTLILVMGLVGASIVV